MSCGAARATLCTLRARAAQRRETHSIAALTPCATAVITNKRKQARAKPPVPAALAAKSREELLAMLLDSLKKLRQRDKRIEGAAALLRFCAVAFVCVVPS